MESNIVRKTLNIILHTMRIAEKGLDKKYLYIIKATVKGCERIVAVIVVLFSWENFNYER